MINSSLKNEKHSGRQFCHHYESFLTINLLGIYHT